MKLINLYKFNISYCLDNNPKLLFLIILKSISFGFLPIVNIILIKNMTDVLLIGSTINMQLAIVLIALLILNVIDSGITRIINIEATKLCTKKLALQIFEKNYSLNYQCAESDYYKQLVNDSLKAIENDYEAMQFIYENLYTVFGRLITLLYFNYILFEKNFIILIIMLIISIVQIYFIKLIDNERETINREKNFFKRKRQYFSDTMGRLENLKEIHIFNLNTLFTKKLIGATENEKKLIIKRRKLEFKYRIICNSVLSLGMIYILYTIININTSYTNLGMTLSQISVVLSYYGFISDLVLNFNRINREVEKIDSLKEYLEINTNNIEVTNNIVEIKPPFKISIKNINFKYENSKKNIFNDFSLNINSNEKIAIVGENGAGKTTLVKLILKLYKPNSGEIFINGIDINNVTDKVYHNLFSTVASDDELFAISVSKNISCETHYDKSKMKKALELANCDFLNKFKSIDEVFFTNRLNENGVSFSGDEKNRLLLARAIYKDTSFYILDEPDSALDPITERTLYKKYDEIFKNKTVVYISHRLYSTRFCDRIIVLENGKIIEEGNHEELIKKQGYYYKMYMKQVQQFKDSK